MDDLQHGGHDAGAVVLAAAAAAIFGGNGGRRPAHAKRPERPAGPRIASTWPRAWAFEKIGPVLRASTVFRYRSKYLEVDNTKLVAALRQILKRQLPPEVARDQLKL
ncbi:MAG: hypothetical protein ACXWKM_03675, partial [Phenylobacterium sp.]